MTDEPSVPIVSSEEKLREMCPTIASVCGSLRSISEQVKKSDPVTDGGKLLLLSVKRASLEKSLLDAQKALDANTFAIAELVPGPDAGQKTKKAGEDLKVIVKRSLIYRPDIDKIRDACRTASSEDLVLYPPIKLKTTEELDEKGYKWYEKNHPHIFKVIAAHVDARPAKVHVQVKPAKKK